MKKNAEITVLSETVRVQRIEKEEFISLTDIAKFRNPDAPADIIKNSGYALDSTDHNLSCLRDYFIRNWIDLGSLLGQA